MDSSRKIIFLAGNQLFPPDTLKRHKDALIFMTEDHAACSYLRHHQHKLVLILAAMRAHADLMRKSGFDVHYEKLEDNPATLSFTDKFDRLLEKHPKARLLYFEMQDKSMARRMEHYVRTRRLRSHILSSPMFLTSREDFANWRERQKEPRMVKTLSLLGPVNSKIPKFRSFTTVPSSNNRLSLPPS